MMEIDIHEESDGSTPRANENDLSNRRVAPDESGEGLPYAPVNWPNPGDTWRWKVGKRVSGSGHFLDRYLYLPKRLCHDGAGNSTGRRNSFASKLAVERYIQASFPGTDLKEFFASFSWKIPAEMSLLANGAVKLKHVPAVPPIPPCVGIEESDSQSDGLCCKARNKLCISLLEKAENPPLVFMECDICCTEAKFCRDCCCILCSKTINFSYGGYDYIRCEALTGEAVICGHAAHIDCALRCYMAGTVGGSIALDSEYYCRRCDARTDLVPHVMRLLHTCESLDSRDNIEKILNIGICILRSSGKTIAKELLKRIEVAIAKLKYGTSLEDIWKQEDGSHHESTAMEVTTNQEPLNGKPSSDLLSASFDYCSESQKLAEDVDQVLHALKNSQESEYKVVEEKLLAQKNYICNLYQQLEKEKSDLARRTSTDPDALLDIVLSRVKQIKREITNLKEMEQIASGFGKTSRATLKKHFNFEVEE
ncbi:PREDICTED: protein OBERON 2 isoform X2 [Fragaria vesca subsp. vesca]|uniref:protein OBERON 2 isoform X2 n=1 Tax=Fragaria vesca subsp. vesca TaxID=101020 RepID=UPI0002C33591|nr:PREDICTED: protein OBERON 2 isoform X2 [Fragaria vesca subsp. vesca]